MNNRVIERPSYIIDASVVARWLLKNPPYLDAALQFATDFREQRVTVLAPENFRYEVSSAIRHTVVTKLLNAAQAEEKIAEFLDLPIPTLVATELILPAYRLSVRFGCGFYDALYLAVADRVKRPFIHADFSLHRTLANRFPFELWIEDYIPTG